jgi:DNA-binding MarR family transcriptional regulator
MQTNRVRQMKPHEVERLADAILGLRAEILRRGGTLDALPGADLTTPQALTLRVAVRSGPLRMSALAAELGVSIATASRTVDALAERGLARRQRDANDARAVLVCATPRGRREHSTRRDRFVSALGSFMRDLAPVDRVELAASLSTVARLLTRGEAGAGPQGRHGAKL